MIPPTSPRKPPPAQPATTTTLHLPLHLPHPPLHLLVVFRLAFFPALLGRLARLDLGYFGFKFGLGRFASHLRILVFFPCWRSLTSALRYWRPFSPCALIITRSRGSCGMVIRFCLCLCRTVLLVLLDPSHGPLVRGFSFRNTLILIVVVVVVGARMASRSVSRRRRRRRPIVIARNGSSSGRRRGLVTSRPSRRLLRGSSRFWRRRRWRRRGRRGGGGR